MNRGNIPGFYYDEEKKKYFKIQANHQVPKDAKYSKSSIQQDKREFKKRKLEDRRRKHVNKQTLKRSLVLLAPLTAGIALHRELGTRSTARTLIDRDAALVKHLTSVKSATELNSSDRYHIELARFEPCVKKEHTVLSLRGAPLANPGRTAYTLHSLPSRYLDHNYPNSQALLMQDIGGPYAAFGSPVSSISTVSVGEDILIFASAQARASPGNVFSTRLMPSTALPPYLQGDDDANVSPYQMTTSTYATLGTLPHTILYSTSIAPTPSPNLVAVAGTLGVWTLDLDCMPLDRLSITRPDYAEPEDDETRAVDWLDPHTIAAGSEMVYLWDQRSGGASQRFRCKGRVTGIFNPERGGSDGGTGGGGQTLLATTNHTISLFDVRYVSKSRPLLSWRHQHEGPQISLTSNGRGLFAAVDRDGWVHVYSTRTGGQVARLPRGGRGALGNLRWWEDGDGRMGLKGLRAEGEVVGWEWSGRDD